MTELTRSQLSSCKEMDEALKAVEICSEEGLQKFLPYEMWIYYMCLEKSTFNRLVLRGRDEVERELWWPQRERYTTVYIHGLYLHIIIMGEHFSLAVLCVFLVHGFCTYTGR